MRAGLLPLCFCTSSRVSFALSAVPYSRFFGPQRSVVNATVYYLDDPTALCSAGVSARGRILVYDVDAPCQSGEVYWGAVQSGARAILRVQPASGNDARAAGFRCRVRGRHDGLSLPFFHANEVDWPTGVLAAIRAEGSEVRLVLSMDAVNPWESLYSSAAYQLLLRWLPTVEYAANTVGALILLRRRRAWQHPRTPDLVLLAEGAVSGLLMCIFGAGMYRTDVVLQGPFFYVLPHPALRRVDIHDGGGGRVLPRAAERHGAPGLACRRARRPARAPPRARAAARGGADPPCWRPAPRPRPCRGSWARCTTC